MNATTDEESEPYLLCGSWRKRPRAAWHHEVQRWALIAAKRLDDWHSGHPEIDCEVFNHPGYQFRDYPPTLIRVPLAVHPERLPTWEADSWVPGLPIVVVEIMDGPERYGDLWERVAEYLACEIPLVWVLTPSDRTITAHRSGVDPVALDARGTLSGFPELPGFSCPVADFFR